MKALQSLGHAKAPAESTLFLAAVVVAWRFSISAMLLAAALGREILELSRLEVLHGGGLGLFGGVGLVLQMDGLAYTAGSTSAFLTQGYCVWIPLWVVFISRRRPSWPLIAATAAVAGGAAILSGITPSNLELGRGELETLAGSVLFTGQILWLERPMFRGNNAMRSTLIMFAVMALATWPAAVMLAHDRVNLIRPLLNAPAAVLLAILVGVCTIATFPLANHWQPRVSATQAGLLYCTEPVFTSAVCLFLPGLFSRWWELNYPNEIVTWHLAIGGILILGANIGLQLWAGGPRKVSDSG